MIELASRNECEGFAERTRKNLEYIERACKEGADVHVVTQLANSLLGLIVFPWEREIQKRIKEITLDVPAWSFGELMKDGKRDSETLGGLVRHLRNAVAHGHLSFSSESRKPDEVKIEFWDGKDRDSHRDWVAMISSANLREFCLHFIHEVVETVG